MTHSTTIGVSIIKGLLLKRWQENGTCPPPRSNTKVLDLKNRWLNYKVSLSLVVAIPKLFPSLPINLVGDAVRTSPIIISTEFLQRPQNLQRGHQYRLFRSRLIFIPFVQSNGFCRKKCKVFNETKMNEAKWLLTFDVFHCSSHSCFYLLLVLCCFSLTMLFSRCVRVQKDMIFAPLKKMPLFFLPKTNSK